MTKFLRALLVVMTGAIGNLTYGEPVQQTWLGLGYDEITQLPMDPCFRESDILPRRFPVKKTDSQVDIVSSRFELQQSIERSQQSSSSISLPFFSFGSSKSSQLVINSSIKSDEIAAVITTRYTDRKELTKSSVPRLNEDSRLRLEYSPLAFRRKCGDSFVREVTLGAQLSLVLKAKLLESDYSKREAITENLSIGLSSISVSIGSGHGEFNKNYFKSLSFELKCLVSGIDRTDLCTRAQATSITSFDELADIIISSQNEFLDLVSQAQELVTVDRQLKYHILPFDMELDRPDPFYDHQPRQLHVVELSALWNEIAEICDHTQYWRCPEQLDLLAEEIKLCGDQSQWAGAGQPHCQTLPAISQTRQKFHHTLSLSEAGTLTLFKGSSFTGVAKVIPLSKVFRSDSRIRPNQRISLAGLGFNPLGSIRIQLNPGWSVKLFRDSPTDNNSIKFSGWAEQASGLYQYQNLLISYDGGK